MGVKILVSRTIHAHNRDDAEMPQSEYPLKVW